MAADNTNDILLRINVDYADAIKKIAEAKKKIDELRAAQRALDTTTDEGRRASAAYATQIAALNAVVRDNQRIVVNGIQQNNAAAGSYRAMALESAQLTAQIRAMSAAERESEAGKALIARNAELIAKLKELDAAQGVYNREVGNYENATRNLRKELKDLINQLLNMRTAGQQNSDEYRAMAAAAAELQDQIGDTQAEIRNMASDTAVLDGMVQAFQGLVGAAGLYSAAMGLSAESTKEVEEVIKKMQIAMGALASIQAIQNALQKESALMQLRDTVLGKVRIVQAWALARAREAEARGTLLATIQSKAYNIIAAANPYMLIVTGIMTVVGAYLALSSILSKTTLAEKSLQEVRKAAAAEAESEVAVLDLYITRIREAKAGRGDLTVALAEYNAKFKEGKELTDSMIATEELLNAELDKRIERIRALKTQEKAQQEVQRLTEELNKNELGFWSKSLAVTKALFTSWGAEMTARRQAAYEQKALTEQAKEYNAAIEAQKKLWGEASQTLEKFTAEQRRQAQQLEIERLQTENMADGLNKRKALLALSFAEQKKKAEGNAELQAEIEKRMSQELLKIIKEYNKEQLDKYYETQSKLIAAEQTVAKDRLTLVQAQQSAELEQIKASGYDRLVVEQAQQRAQLEQQQGFELRKLDLQKRAGKITQQEYTAALNAIQLQTQIAIEKQQADQVRFYEKQTESLRALMQYDAQEDINAVKAAYTAAYKDLEQLQNISEGARAVMRTRMQREEEARVTEIRVNAEQTRSADDLAALTNNAKARLEREIELQQQIIAIKKEGNQSIVADEAALFDLRKQLLALNEQAELVAVEKNERKKFDIRKKYLLDLIASTKEGTNERAALERDLATLEESFIVAQQERVVAYAEKSGQVLGSLNELFSQLGANRIAEVEAENESEKASLQRRLDAGMISQKEYNKKVAALDKDLADKKAEQARKDAIRNKALAIFDIILSTGTAVMQALKFPPPASFAFAAAASGIGLAQLATVAATPLPKAARGMEVRGASHAGGGVHIEAEGGELVINKRSAQMFRPVLSAMNVAGGGVPFTNAGADGGFALREERRRSGAVDLTELAATLTDSMREVQIYTAIEDINKGEELYSQSTDIRRV